MVWLAWVLGAITIALLAMLSIQFQSRAIPDRYVQAKDKVNTSQQAKPPEKRFNRFRLAGCIALQGNDECTSGLETLLPHANTVQAALQGFVRPTQENSPNTRVFDLNGALIAPIKQGRNVTLTLDPTWATRAQTTVDCYTGMRSACVACPWCVSVANDAMYEGAPVRSMGLLVVNAHTGGITAAASAYTPCYAQLYGRSELGADCPDLPDAPIHTPDMLGSRVFDQQARPGSITKLIIYLGLLRVGLRSAEMAQLPTILARSQTLPLIDIIFCESAQFNATCAAQRVNSIAQVAAQVGWNGMYQDSLDLGQSADLNVPRFGARFMHLANGKPMTVWPHELSEQELAACSSRQWKSCKGMRLGQLVSEFFGTGDALASPLGVANLMLALHTSATDRPALQAHLIAAAQAPTPRAEDANVPIALSDTPHPRQLLNDLVGGIASFGTAHSACTRAARAMPGGHLPCTGKARSEATLEVFGKTGTTVFSADVDKSHSTPLPQWSAACREDAQKLANMNKETDRLHHVVKNRVDKCAMPPNKLYVALVRQPQSGQAFVIVTFAERNWNRNTQLIEGHNESTANIATEAALSLVNRMFFPATSGTKPAGTSNASLVAGAQP